MTSFYTANPGAEKKAIARIERKRKQVVDEPTAQNRATLKKMEELHAARRRQAKQDLANSRENRAMSDKSYYSDGVLTKDQLSKIHAKAVKATKDRILGLIVAEEVHGEVNESVIDSCSDLAGVGDLVDDEERFQKASDEMNDEIYAAVRSVLDPIVKRLEK